MASRNDSTHSLSNAMQRRAKETGGISLAVMLVESSTFVDLMEIQMDFAGMFNENRPRERSHF